MTLSLIDRDGQATIAAAEGQAALASGDTPRAREKFAEAGAILEKSIGGARRQAEKHLLRFLAASQYYHGGNYRKALDLCKKIEQRLLPRETRPLFPQFLQDVRTRASAGYESRVRRELQEHGRRKDHARMLQALQEHPYVLPPGVMAFDRALISQDLKNYQAAALFFADVFRRYPDHPGLVFIAAAIPQRQGKLEEAWDYVRHQLEVLPHPATYVVASLIFFHRGSAAYIEDGNSILKEQVRYFNRAGAGYADLSAQQQANPEMRALMALGFEAVALGRLRHGEVRREEFEGLLRRAREIDPANGEFENNYRLFLDSLNSRPSGTVIARDQEPGRELEERFLFDRESRLLEVLKGTNPVTRELQGAGV
jgi:tetratricopeptide (TPR) repeat protein